MSDREFKINEFMNRGIIESNIEFSQEHSTSMCVAKFGYEVDIEDGFFFKDLISFIHSFSDFNTILQQPNDTFLIFLKDCKLHEAKGIMKQMLDKVKYKFKIDIKHMGITLVDENDDMKSLLERLDRYYVMSKLSSRKKIFYGTLDFDYYETQSEKKVLESIFKKLSIIKLYNFYQGLPITEKVNILTFDKGVIQVKIDPIKLPFYDKEQFTFIQHELIPATIKASIMKIEPNRSLMILGNLEFLDSSPVERTGMRVEPDRDIYVSASLGNKKILDGTVASLSENSIVLTCKPDKVKSIVDEPLWDEDLILQFQIPTKKSFLAMVKTKATLYSIINDKVVFNIMPNTVIKSKLRNYISLRQSSLLIDLKKDLKKN